MRGRVLIIHWDEREGSEIRNDLESLGLEVQLESEDGVKAYRTIEETRPDVVLIYLTRRPLEGMSNVASFLDRRTMTDIPMLFVGEESEKVAHFEDMLKVPSIRPRDRMITALKEVLDRKWM
ncbi:MAG: hypothetical protein R6V01_01835 [Thermoplasmatota archaeon]